MWIIPSLHIWTQLPVSERQAVAEAVVRILTEEVEHERFGEDPADSPQAAAGRLHQAIRSQTGPEESREPLQPACPPRAIAGAGLEEGPGYAHRGGPGTVRHRRGRP